jgi:hypothetical protein
VVGLGLNERELQANEWITEYVIHDLNRNPVLPFLDNQFDVVVNTVSVDYMTKPIEVFAEVGRVLKPGGLFLVIFSNRMFDEKAVEIWRQASEEERVLLVEDFYRASGSFEETTVFASKGKPRPPDDKYAPIGIPSDPIYAVYADKTGGDPSRQPRPAVRLSSDVEAEVRTEEFQRRRASMKDTLRCPHCDQRMRKWAVPENPFAATWADDFMYICFNDACPYYVRGWDFMFKEGNSGKSYRLMYNPRRDACQPIPVPTPQALRESIVD